MSEIKFKPTLAGTTLSTCSECRNRFTEDNKPLSLGCFCKELLCTNCVAKIVEAFEGAECPRCTQLIEKKRIKVDEGVLEIVLLLRAREVQTAERYQNQIDVLKDVIKAFKQKQKQQQSVLENLKYQIRQNDTEKQIIKEKYTKMIEEQRKGFEDKLKQSGIEVTKALQKLEAQKKQREAAEVKYQHLQVEYENMAIRMEQLSKDLQAHQTHKARMEKQMAQLRKNCKQFEGHINQRINESRAALIQFANLQFNEEITIKLQPLEELEKEESAKIEAEVNISRLQDSMLQVHKQIKTVEKKKEIQHPKKYQRQQPGPGSKNKSEITVSKETKSDQTIDQKGYEIVQREQLPPKHQKLTAQIENQIEPTQLKHLPNQSTAKALPIRQQLKSQRKQGRLSTVQLVRSEAQPVQPNNDQRSNTNRFGKAYSTHQYERSQPSCLTDYQHQDYSNYYSHQNQDLTYDRYFEQEYFEPGEEEYSYPRQPPRNMSHSQHLHPGQMHYQVEHSPWSEIFARHDKQGEQSKQQAAESGYREARQMGLQQEVIRINMKINQFMKNENLRKKVQEDHVVKFLKQLDRQGYIKPEEYYLITDVENKKSDAQKKLELIISLRKGEYPKYKNLELQLFSYTIETIKSVRLDNLKLEKLVNLSAINNLKALDVSNNLLRSIKPIEDNILLQILYLNSNCLQNLDGLIKLANLRKLSIHENKLSQSAYLYLSKCQLSKLKQIWLGSSYLIQNKGENDQCLKTLLSRCYPALTELHLNLKLFYQWREVIQLYNCKYHAHLGVMSLD